jgi:probable HAF family extracellular repeat protein
MGFMTVRRHRSSVFAAIIALTLIAGAGRADATLYDVTDLGTLGGSTSQAYAINTRGDVAGSSTLSGDMVGHAFLYKARHGQLLDLDPQGNDRNSRAWAINGRGQVAGDTYAAWAAGVHPAVFRHGKVIDLAPVPAFTYAAAVGINDAGDLLIHAWTPPRLLPAQGFLLHHGILAALPITFVTGINNRHQVVGATGDPIIVLQAVSYRRGELASIGGSLGARGISANAVNDRGDIAGGFLDGDLTGHAFLDRAGVTTDLGTLPGGLEAAGLALNVHDQVVGYAFDYSTTFIERAFLYDARLLPSLQDLNDLIPANLGIVLNRATAINDDGIIAGYGTVGGQFHAFILRPHPSS